MYTHKHIDREDGTYRRWWDFGRHFGARIEFCWKSHSYHFDPIKYDTEDGWGFSLAFRPVALYVHIKLPRPFRLRDDRELGFSFHGGALWWDLWVDPMGGYPCPQGKWRDSCFHFDDFFLGKSKCTREVLEERDVLVPMPEKAYPAHAKLMRYTWTRPRWFSKSIKRVEIDIPDGIPHEGKGENSWDCGHDATFSMTTGECNSIPEGVGKLVGSCLKDRVKYGGWGDWKWDKPKEEIKVNKDAVYGMKCMDAKAAIITPNTATA